MTEGVDYAWSRPRPGELARLGKRFACRYLSWLPNGKVMTASEVQTLTAAGIAVVSNWEYTAGGALGGRSVGASHAREAHRIATSCGMPADRPIYFSVDFDATDVELSIVDEYLRGCADVLGAARVGVYGGYRTIAHCAQARTARWLWQTYAWSGGRWWPGAHIQQYRNGVTIDGADCDLDRAMTVDYGQWGVEDMSTASDEILAKWSKGVPTLGDGTELTPVVWRIRDERWQAAVAGKLDALLGRPALVITPDVVDQLADQLSAALAARPDTPLGESDQPAIKQALAELLREGIG